VEVEVAGDLRQVLHVEVLPVDALQLGTLEVPAHHAGLRLVAVLVPEGERARHVGVGPVEAAVEEHLEDIAQVRETAVLDQALAEVVVEAEGELDLPALDRQRRELAAVAVVRAEVLAEGGFESGGVGDLLKAFPFALPRGLPLTGLAVGFLDARATGLDAPHYQDADDNQGDEVGQAAGLLRRHQRALP